MAGRVCRGTSARWPWPPGLHSCRLGSPGSSRGLRATSGGQPVRVTSSVVCPRRHRRPVVSSLSPPSRPLHSPPRHRTSVGTRGPPARSPEGCRGPTRSGRQGPPGGGGCVLALVLPEAELCLLHTEQLWGTRGSPLRPRKPWGHFPPSPRRELTETELSPYCHRSACGGQRGRLPGKKESSRHWTGLSLPNASLADQRGRGVDAWTHSLRGRRGHGAGAEVPWGPHLFPCRPLPRTPLPRRGPRVPPLSMAPGDIYGTLAPCQALNWALDLRACPLCHHDPLGSHRTSPRTLSYACHLRGARPRAPSLSPWGRWERHGPGRGACTTRGLACCPEVPPRGQIPLLGQPLDKLSSSKLKEAQLQRASCCPSRGMFWAACQARSRRAAARGERARRPGQRHFRGGCGPASREA